MFSSTHAQSLGIFPAIAATRPPDLCELPPRRADRKGIVIPPGSRRRICVADSRVRCVKNARSSAASNYPAALPMIARLGPGWSSLTTKIMPRSPRPLSPWM
jgi:hypothetical protein